MQRQQLVSEPCRSEAATVWRGGLHVSWRSAARGEDCLRRDAAGGRLRCDAAVRRRRRDAVIGDGGVMPLHGDGGGERPSSS
jgi:hypothetical protein